MAIINSDALQEAVQPFMSKGLFGARDLHNTCGSCRYRSTTRKPSSTWRHPMPEHWQRPKPLTSS